MKNAYPSLSPGYSVVPPGKLASAVTCLEMRERPSRAVPSPAVPSLAVAGTAAGLSLQRLGARDLDLAAYRRLFRAVGEDWLWSSRLEISDEALRAIVQDSSVETYVLSDGDGQIGLVELDFRQPDACELVFLGLIKGAIGKGRGRYLMEQALAIVWSHPIRRFWLHTCHLDHPKALEFYQSFGFRPFAFWVEVFDDPRISGVLPRAVAPHVPILDTAETR